MHAWRTMTAVGGAVAGGGGVCVGKMTRAAPVDLVIGRGCVRSRRSRSGSRLRPRWISTCSSNRMSSVARAPRRKRCACSSEGRTWRSKRTTHSRPTSGDHRGDRAPATVTPDRLPPDPARMERSSSNHETTTSAQSRRRMAPPTAWAQDRHRSGSLGIVALTTDLVGRLTRTPAPPHRSAGSPTRSRTPALPHPQRDRPAPQPGADDRAAAAPVDPPNHNSADLDRHPRWRAQTLIWTTRREQQGPR